MNEKEEKFKQLQKEINDKSQLYYKLNLYFEEFDEKFINIMEFVRNEYYKLIKFVCDNEGYYCMQKLPKINCGRNVIVDFGNKRVEFGLLFNIPNKLYEYMAHEEDIKNKKMFETSNAMMNIPYIMLSGKFGNKCIKNSCLSIVSYSILKNIIVNYGLLL